MPSGHFTHKYVVHRSSSYFEQVRSFPLTEYPLQPTGVDMHNVPNYD